MKGGLSHQHTHTKCSKRSLLIWIVYQTWFTWLSRNWCLCLWFAWSQGLHHLLSKLGSINLVISFWNFRFFVVSAQILSVQFLLPLDFSAYKKICYFLLLLFKIYYSTKKSFKKTFIGFCHRKLNKGKLDQINSELTQNWYSDYWGPSRTIY